MKLNIVFVSEADSRMGLFYRKNGNVRNRSEHEFGIGVMVFDMLNTIVDMLETENRIEGSLRSLILFREKQTDGTDNMTVISDKAIKESRNRGELNVVSGYHSVYNRSLGNLINRNRESDEFCTGRALQRAVTAQSRHKDEFNVMVFMAGSSKILSSVSGDELICRGKNGEQTTPDLSLCFLNDTVSAADAAKLSRLNTAKNQVRIFCSRSVADNIRTLQIRYNLDPANVTRRAVETRSGIPYAIYGLLSDLAEDSTANPDRR